jgi:hypothetical protein
MEKRIKLKVSEIVQDFSFYFREHTDPQHVRYMRHALESDAEFPPCVVDLKSHKLIDGYHRLAMYQSVKGDDHIVDCIAKSYESDNAMFLDSLRLNRDCKRGITTND